MRSNNRAPDQLRSLEVQRSPQKHPAGSVLIRWGETHVVCSVMVEDKVPHWMQGQPGGWITAEYGMLPGCSDKRIHRDKSRNTGRTHEIQRLIGRSLRACMALQSFAPKTLLIDCDVIQADGGTRVASVTGAFMAVSLALQKLKDAKSIAQMPALTLIAAVSLGKVDGKWILDLDYSEDVRAEVDANVVMNEKGEFIEIQGTAEKNSFSRAELNTMLELAEKGCRDVFEVQRRILKDWGLRN